ncbi:hypothetical protein FRC17_003173 [Serendipita sp. 399]|nr:hypothetical protein FRC17_003173 [Serendipita sp. 399]
MNRPRRGVAKSEQTGESREDAPTAEDERAPYGLRSRKKIAASIPIEVAKQQEDTALSAKPENEQRAIVTRLPEFPDEVFSIVFEFYVEDYYGSPWTLMHVCRRWRTTATHARRLWSRIMVTQAIPRFYEPWEPSRRYLNYEVCHREHLLRDALARVASGPLDIRLAFTTAEHGIYRPEADILGRGLIEVLRSEKAYLRIRCLEATRTSEAWLEHATFEEFEFPSLQRAILLTGSKDLVTRIQSTASRLQNLDLTQNGVDPFNWNLSPLKYLTDLRLTKYGRPAGDGGFRMIASARHLVNLILNLVNISTRETLSIPTLQRLNLWLSQIDVPLDLPQLQILSLNNSTIFTTKECPLTFPSLVTLNVEGCKLDGLFYIAPQLHTLSISQISDISKPPRKSRFSIMLEQVVKSGFLSSRRLCLSRVSMDSKLLVEMLREMPQLEEIEIGDGVPLQMVFFEAVGGCRILAKKTSEHREPVCTQLKSFRVSLHGIRKEATETAMLRWSHMAVQARAEGKYPLEQAFLKEKNSIRWVSMLEPTST